MLTARGSLKAAHPAKGAEMMVERAVLLHQDDDVLHISNRSGALFAGIASALAMFAFSVLDRRRSRPSYCRN